MGINLHNSSVIGQKSVGFVLNIRKLSIYKRGNTFFDERRDLVLVEISYCVLNAVARVEALVSVVSFPEKVPLASVGVTAEFAYHCRTRFRNFGFEALKVNMIGINVAFSLPEPPEVESKILVLSSSFAFTLSLV